MMTLCAYRTTRAKLLLLQTFCRSLLERSLQLLAALVEQSSQALMTVSLCSMLIMGLQVSVCEVTVQLVVPFHLYRTAGAHKMQQPSFRMLQLESNVMQLRTKSSEIGSTSQICIAPTGPQQCC